MNPKMQHFRAAIRDWRTNLGRDLFGPYGYRTWIVCVTTIIAAYFSVYAVLESRHDRQLNRALFERNLFISMVSSGNKFMFLSAIKDFGAVQRIEVPVAPGLLTPWNWAGHEYPNEEPLLRWAGHRFPLCTARDCGLVDASGKEVFRIDLLSANLRNANLNKLFLVKSRLTNAKLDSANLRDALLIGALLESAVVRGADLRDAKLIGAVLNGADLTGSDLRGADLQGAIFRTPDRTVELNGRTSTLPGKPADLRAANLLGVKNARPGQLNLAYWDEKTTWPDWHTPPCKRNVPEDTCDIER